MAASKLIEQHREGAEIHRGHNVCKEQCAKILGDLALPKGLLPLEDIEELGYDRGDGFVWLIQKKKTTHSFDEIKQLVSYATAVTAFVEERRLRRITGVKAKELLLWFTVVEVYSSLPEKITFKTGTGLSDTFPASVFDFES